MALTDKLTAIADAIRSKSGKSGTMTLDQMPMEIEALSAEEKLKASEYPAYVSPEVLEVANKVNSVRKSDSIVFVAMSDSHYCADQVLNFYETETNASVLQANQAAKVLAYLLDADFFAHLGDVSCGADSTTPDMLKKQIEGFISYFREAKSDLPVFICIGNHDAGIYYHNAQTDGNIHTMPGEYLYQNFTAYSESEDTVIGGTEYGGYCYRDFADKKLRVIMLNTAEQIAGSHIDNATYGAQRLWLANALLDLNSKDDAANWGFIILCHYPADYGSATAKISKLLSAYVNGGSITITDNSDGTNATVNFSKNSAKMIAQFHGHIHNFKYDKLYDNGTQYDAWRICIPNGQFNRENTYGTIGGINYKEDKTYTKTINTENGTSFVINVINPSEEKIYSFCYGAGYDRVIGYGAETLYSIIYDLTAVEMLNKVYSVKKGEPLSVSVDSAGVADGYDITTATVVMGGVDITSSAYNNGQISIANVTGNVIITIKATKAPTTNLGLIAEEGDSTNIYNNGLGYKNNYRLVDSSDEMYERAESGYVVTGYIPYVVQAGVLPKTIIIQGATLDEAAYCKIRFFKSTKTTTDKPYISGAPTSKEKAFSEIFTIKTLGDKHYKLIPIPDSSTGGMIGTNSVPNIAYMRLSLIGTGEDLIITFDDTDIDDPEPISYTITNNLTNVTTNNNVTSVESGSNYTASLYADSGYNLTSVTVTMGGVDITSSVYGDGMMSFTVTGNVVITATATAATPNTYSVTFNPTNCYISNSTSSVTHGSSYAATVYANDGYELKSLTVTMGGSPVTVTDRSIVIPNVTGDIVIAAIADSVQVSYTNQLPISTDTDGSIYNGRGYKENTYLSSGDAKTRSGVYTSGFIPCKKGNTLYFENCTMPDNDSNCRVSFFNSAKTYIANTHWTTVNDSEKLTITYGADGNITTLTLTDHPIFDNAAYIRFCCNYLGADSIVTVNEPIE